MNELRYAAEQACWVLPTLLGLLAASGCAKGQQAGTSAQITALRDGIRKSPSAVADFITQVKTRGGTPLIEAIDGDEHNVHVTFLWQGDSSTRGVLIDWYPFTISRTAELSMVRMEGTDLWYRTLRVPRGSRFLYQLSVNDPRTTIPVGTGSARPGPDPLNPRRDIAELPGAPAQPYLARREGVPRLTMNRERIASRILNEDRPLFVYTPPGWNPRLRTPSLLLFDGEQEEGLVFASATIENLVHERKVPPIVIARIPNLSGRSRMRDLGCSTEFTDFLAKEVAPLLQSKYGVSKLASESGVGGASRGGLAAVCAALRAPDRFGLVISQSGSLWFVPRTIPGKPYREPGWVVEQFLERPKLPVRFYLDVGKFEWDATGEGFGTLEPARRLRDVLRAKGYDVTYQEFLSGHDDITWRGSLADALIALFGPLRKPPSAAVQ
jgi:enterochelin esterase-like enzyme